METTEEGIGKKEIPVKLIAVAVVGIILVLVLYVIFVPKLVSKTENKTAEYQIVDQDYSVNDKEVCVEWFLTICTRHEWEREITASARVRAISRGGDFGVILNLYPDVGYQSVNELKTKYISSDTTLTFNFETDYFRISDDEHDSEEYTMTVDVIPPTWNEVKEQTLFESWTS